MTSSRTPGFSLLENQDEILTSIERLNQRPLSETALTMVLAELFRNYDLRSEAIERLWSAPQADDLVDPLAIDFRKNDLQGFEIGVNIGDKCVAHACLSDSLLQLLPR